MLQALVRRCPVQRCLLGAYMGFLLAACAESNVDSTPPNPEPKEGEALSAQTREGPVEATVTLTPAEPRLGDPLVLTLTVQAEANVAVHMPAFGDALGRFDILDFTPREEVAEDGGQLKSQRYTLQAPMSGPQRIPRLRIEFLDERGGQPATAPRELLTDELGFNVASVLPEGEIGTELRPARAALAELQGPWLQRHWAWLAAALVVLIGAAAGVVLWLRRAEQRARLTAYDRALARLQRLERRGLPKEAQLDGWYVELSDIVRRYIEGRFGLRAPELTTEEFLLEAGRSAEISKPHCELLSAFLERCDRVKFARYNPGGDGESQEALDLARRFLRETRDAAAESGTDGSPNLQPAAAGAR